jgi:hypothetical protein
MVFDLLPWALVGRHLELEHRDLRRSVRLNSNHLPPRSFKVHTLAFDQGLSEQMRPDPMKPARRARADEDVELGHDANGIGDSCQK